MPGRSLFFEEGIITCFFVCVKRERGGGGGRQTSKGCNQCLNKTKNLRNFYIYTSFPFKKKDLFYYNRMKSIESVGSYEIFSGVG